MAEPRNTEIYDFIFSSDVFEHVPPPAQRAFETCHSLLKKNGTLIFSVPYNLDGNTLEHFPDLHDYFIDDQGDSPVLKNLTIDGKRQEFENLIFHGGDGATLEMRVFSLPDLINFANSRVPVGENYARAVLQIWHLLASKNLFADDCQKSKIVALSLRNGDLKL